MRKILAFLAIAGSATGLIAVLTSSSLADVRFSGSFLATKEWFRSSRSSPALEMRQNNKDPHSLTSERN